LDANATTYSSILTCTPAGSLKLTAGYSSIKDAGKITVTARITGTPSEKNWEVTEANKTFTIEVVPVKSVPHVEFKYAGSTNADTPWRNEKNEPVLNWADKDGYSMVLPSQTRPDVLQKIVENGNTGNCAYIVKNLPTEANSDKDYAAFTNGSSGLKAADLTYVYYYADGTKLPTNMVPSKDGKYTVEVYIKEATLAGTTYTTDDIDITVPAATLTLYIGCDSSNYTSIPSDSTSGRGYYIEDGMLYNGDDDLVKNQFQDIDGVTYYADENGEVVKGRVFTAADGSRYYAKIDGTIRKNGKYRTAGGGYVYAKADGKLLVSASVVIGGKRYVANKNGKLVKEGFSTTKKGYKYYLQNYVAVTSKVINYTNDKTGKSYKYIATASGKIAMGNKVVTLNGKKYYVYAKGSVKTSGTVKYNGKTYKVGKSGVLTLKK
jgi:hypothetical protein